MTTLTDRYVDATVRRLPGQQRADIEQELRASIADAVEDRRHAGDDEAEAERAVLTELGDPARLAARYADKPTFLIGPAHYHEWVRLLTALLATVLPAVVVGIAIAKAVAGDPAGEIVGGAIGMTITVGVHLVFWTTLLFAAVERVPSMRWQPARPWTLDDLPQTVDRRVNTAGMIAGAAFLALFFAFVLLSPAVSTEHNAAGDPIGLLSPWLWDTGVVYVYIASMILGLGFRFAEPRLRWTLRAALTRAVVEAAAPVVLLVMAATGHILNPAFVAAAGWPADTERWTAIGVTVVAVATLVRVVVDLVSGLRVEAWPGANSFRTQVRAAATGVSGRVSPRRAR
jgi:hypothetical protein